MLFIEAHWGSSQETENSLSYLGSPLLHLQKVMKNIIGVEIVGGFVVYLSAFVVERYHPHIRDFLLLFLSKQTYINNKK
jgi:hypothetical protein